MDGDSRTGRVGRRTAPSLVRVLLGAVILVGGCGTNAATDGGSTDGGSTSGGSTSGSAAAPIAAPTMPPSTPAALPAAEPTGIEIPAIGVRAPVMRVGLNPDGTVEVPTLERAAEVGWYEHGPTPGDLGPAVLLGHIDSRSGPAVFFRLGELRPGDTVRVVRNDGSTAVFRTTSVERVPKDEFPTERVYGDLDHVGLRLVTCGGAFDRRRGSYTANVIVYAVLTSVERDAQAPPG